jgi:signal transduction histidine kinase/DNA-binding response OmpR family regulator
MTRDAQQDRAAHDCLSGGGNMGALMRATDWGATPFGRVEQWPQSLRTAVSIMLESPFAMVVAWGRDFRFFYNDRYQPILGAKHPAALGRAGAEIFPEVWGVVGPEFERVRRGESFAIDDWYLPLERNGYPENCWFTLAYSPIRDETGGVGGVLAVVADTTVRVDSERRLATLRDLAQAAASVKTDVEACTSAAAIVERNPIDVPFALFYLFDDDSGQLKRACLVGIDDDHPAARVTLEIGSADAPWPCEAAFTSGVFEVAPDLDVRFGRPLPGGPHPEPCTTAVVLPLVRRGAEKPYGVVVAGVSPRRELDEAYRTFFTLASEHVATAIGNARAFEEERRRARQLAELDRAKTTFFSNVSHEFRTPLTLMLGPVEDLLADGDVAPHHREVLSLAHRNGLRLRKLVNTLLDFSRIEAGRIEATYEPVDLAEFTAELASVFRAAIDKAGLQYSVECSDIGEPVYVDREMWEKIVLNLISNAFKFTLAGQIVVSVRRDASEAVVTVRDTGSGIPARELPHVFERFHRVEGTQGRTHEGTGIGLALVQELVKLHAGTISIDSTLGAGTSVHVRLPLGHKHLPADRVVAERLLTSTAVGAEAFVEEALRWLPDAQPLATSVAGDDTRCILVADDNADMRAYIRRLLGSRWQVEVVADGKEALSFVTRRRPDLVIADVMMPRMDGLALLQAIRSNPELRAIPVVLLSARAGDEARIEGLQAGADDYLVKPFSARELMTRTEAQLLRAEVHAIEESHERRLTTIFQHAPVAIAILKGPEHVFEFANNSYFELAGRSNVIGRTIREVFPEFTGQGIFELLDTVYASGQPYMADSLRVQMRRRGADDLEDVYFKFVYQPMPGPSGEIEGIAVVATDVTDLANARREAEGANRAKDEFLAMLGHELRNPLAPILTALQLMSIRDAGETTAKERAVIDRQVRHLMRLVDDLLDVSRIARGKVDLSRENVELSRCVAQAVEMVSPLLEQRRHNLVLDVPRSGLVINGDLTRLSQVIQNLLTNAAKYTEPGGQIEIRARQMDDFIHLVVKDNGVGIPAELMPQVFDLFVQGRQSMDRSKGGLGLGLTLVRTLVELHGGSVDARSDGAGCGTEFHVRLLAAPPASVVAPAHDRSWRSSAIVSGTRLLVVDDNADAASMLAEALRTFGYDVRIALDGPTALEIAARFDPRIVLLDLGLPVMDGYEVAERLRAAGMPALAVALTGYGQESDRARSTASGFAAHLVKPVDFDELRRCLDRLLAPVGDT